MSTTTTTALKAIPTRTLGLNGPQVPSIGLGLMAIGAHYGTPSTQKDVNKLLDAAYDSGARLWDTSDVYGDSQKLIGHWLSNNPSKRSNLFLSTKYGYTRLPSVSTFAGACSLPSYIPQALASSLSILNTSYIDIYFQHRVDPQVPIELVMEALRPALEEGKVRWLGLSECSVETLRRAKGVKGVGEKLVAVQMEYSPFTLDIERNGFADACKELGVSVVCYSPLGRGMVSGRYRSRVDLEPTDGRLWLPRFQEENFHKNLLIVDQFKAVASELGCMPSQVCLAWILASQPDWIPIPGTRSPLLARENTLGATITLPPTTVAYIRKLVDEAEVAGARYMDALMSEVEGNCVKLDEWKGEGSWVGRVGGREGVPDE